MQQQTHRLRPFAAALVTLGALAFTAPASATVLASIPTDYLANVGSLAPGIGWQAAGFTMNAGQDYRLTDVLFPWIVNQGAGTYYTPLVSVWSDNGSGVPGTLIANLSLLSETSPILDLDFGPTTPLTLTGGATYWFMLQNHAGGKAVFRWGGNASSSSVVANAATYQGFWMSTTSAAGVNPGPGNGNLPALTLNGTPVSSSSVPEPGSLMLLGIGLAGWLGARRRA